LERFEAQNNYTGGIRQDINEKFIGQKYFVDMSRFNFDSIVGTDKIKERLQFLPYELNSGNGIDGVFEYNYLDSSSVSTNEDIAVSGGKIYSITTPNTLTGNNIGYTNTISGLKFTSFSVVANQIAKSWEAYEVPEDGDQIIINNGTQTEIWLAASGVFTQTLPASLPINPALPIDIIFQTISVRTISFSWIPAAQIYSGIQTGLVSFAVHQGKLFIANGKDYPITYWGAKGLCYQMGSPCAEVLATAGNLNGAYYYAITYVTDGGEEYSGTLSNTINPVSKQVQVNLPEGYAGTVQRYLYRTTASGSILYRLAIINDNTTLTYIDNTTDANLINGADLVSYITTDFYWVPATVPQYVHAYSTINNKTLWRGNPPTLPPPTLTVDKFAPYNTVNFDATHVFSAFNIDAIYSIQDNDFDFRFWVKTSNNIDDGVAFSIFATGVGGTSGNVSIVFNSAVMTYPRKVEIQINGTSYVSQEDYPVNQWIYVILKRKNTLVTLQWSDETTWDATPKISTYNNDIINSDFFQIVCYQNTYTTLFQVGAAMRLSIGHTFEDYTGQFWWNNGQGSVSTYEGAKNIIGINNECPKPNFLQVQYSRLAACGTPVLSDQLFVTDTYKEVFDITNGVDVGGQSNDNTPLTGISQDYVNTVVFSKKNIFMVDLSADPVTSKNTRANIGCNNGFSVVRLPQYRDFEGGVAFLSTLNDFRIFNSNFAQPLITLSLAEGVTDENWSRAISPIIDYYIGNFKQSFFYDYKYHVSFGNTILALDIRNQGWTKYDIQDANCFGLFGNYLYCGRTDTSYIDQMYASELLYGTDQFDAYMESGAIMSSEKENFFEDLYFYHTVTGYNKLQLEIILEDDYNHVIKKEINIRKGGAEYFDSQYYSNTYYSTLEIKDDYFVYHINRWARWLKWKLTSQEGRFLYRGSKVVGQRTGEKQIEK